MEESLDLYKSILDQFQIKKQNVCTYSPLTLAYIGDAIYEIIIRTIVVGEGNRQVNQLHKKSSNLAKAATQAEMVLKLQPFLEEEEEQIYKRGRNADIIDYRNATGFEALMGYLYMQGKTKRMFELVKKGMELL